MDDTVHKTAKVVNSCFGQATDMGDMRLIAFVSGLDAVS